jgi:glycerophosphoryl diester phosphodiesterase
VAAHDDCDTIHEVFMETKIHNKYTPLDLYGIAKLLEKYPDAFFVTDTKYTDSYRIEIEFRQIQEICGEYMNRIIPQVYTFEMYDQIMGIYEFENVIVTLYQMGYTIGVDEPFILQNILQREKIKAVTMWDTWVNKNFIDMLSNENIASFAHTVNDLTVYNNLKLYKITGIYSDFLFF